MIDIHELKPDDVCKGVIVAALLSTPDGSMSEGEMETIWGKCRADLSRAAAWRLVIDGRAGVVLDGDDVLFRAVPEKDQRSRRAGIAAAMRLK